MVSLVSVQQKQALVVIENVTCARCHRRIFMNTSLSLTNSPPPSSSPPPAAAAAAPIQNTQVALSKIPLSEGMYILLALSLSLAREKKNCVIYIYTRKDGSADGMK
jgi:hypothetical protein